MKAIPVILLLCSTLNSHAQSIHKFDYTVIFGDLYNGANISLQINDKQVVKNFHLNNHDPRLKGNLNLVQANDALKINFNGTDIIKAPVSYDHHLNLKVAVNKKVEKMEVDLRKGNILILNWTNGELAVQQLQEPFLLDVAGNGRR